MLILKAGPQKLLGCGAPSAAWSTFVSKGVELQVVATVDLVNVSREASHCLRGQPFGVVLTGSQEDITHFGGFLNLETNPSGLVQKLIGLTPKMCWGLQFSKTQPPPSVPWPVKRVKGFRDTLRELAKI